MDNVLAVHDAQHRYGRTVALDGVSLTVRAGECVALLGPNGAGKTTLVGLATGLLRPMDSTRIEVAGGDPRYAATRRNLGVVQQSIGFPRTLKVSELVRGAATRAGQTASAAERILAEVGLTHLTARRAHKLSGGEQQRLQLAMALVSDPYLLVLDEPTVGLDIDARAAFWRTLTARRDAGAGVLVTTHVIEDAAAVADRVVVLHRGKVIAADTPSALASRLPNRRIQATTRVKAGKVANIPGVATVNSDAAGRITLTSDRPEQVVRALLEQDPELCDLRVEGASLEQALIALLGQESGDFGTNATSSTTAQTQEMA